MTNFHVYILLMWLTTSTINAQDYDERGTLLYEDLGCRPINQDPNNKLASSYDCDQAFYNPCYYENKNYTLHDHLPWQISLLSCSSSCRCKANGFLCSALRCPEIGLVTLSNSTCYHIYTINECCNVGEMCPPFDNVATCVVDGTTYMKGQKFFPTNTNFHCICNENFNGKYDSGSCRKISCGIKLKNQEEINQRCAPYYSDKNRRQCPTSWICPSDEFKDDVISSGQQQSGASCVYGSKKLQIGDYFKRKQLDYVFRVDKHVRCTCLVPPLLTCITNRTVPWK